MWKSNRLFGKNTNFDEILTKPLHCAARSEASTTKLVRIEQRTSAKTTTRIDDIYHVCRRRAETRRDPAFSRYHMATPVRAAPSLSVSAASRASPAPLNSPSNARPVKPVAAPPTPIASATAKARSLAVSTPDQPASRFFPASPGARVYFLNSPCQSVLAFYFLVLFFDRVCDDAFCGHAVSCCTESSPVAQVHDLLAQVQGFQKRQWR